MVAQGSIGNLLEKIVAHVATSAPVVDENADPLTIARTRARGWGSILGAALALVVAFIEPRLSQFALISIPVFLRIAVARAERRVKADQPG